MQKVCAEVDVHNKWITHCSKFFFFCALDVRNGMCDWAFNITSLTHRNSHSHPQVIIETKNTSPIHSPRLNLSDREVAYMTSDHQGLHFESYRMSAGYHHLIYLFILEIISWPNCDYILCIHSRVFLRTQWFTGKETELLGQRSSILILICAQTMLTSWDNKAN